MSLADVAKKQATNALVKYGEVMQLKTHVGQTKNTTTGVVTPSYTTPVTCHGARNATQYKSLGFKYGEDLVRNGDFEVTLAAEDGVSPNQGSLLVIENKDHEIVSYQPTFFMGIIVVYNLLVRA